MDLNNSNELNVLNDENEISKISFHYLEEIKFIYHISDVHIQLYKRHHEYEQSFQKFYEYLKNEKKKYNISSDKNTNIPLICCCTGDLLHSKTDLSPECVQVCYNFLKSISNIMPLVVIPGNHDLNMNNKNKLDSITPILSDLPNINPIYYLKQTGIYQMNNIFFSHSSIFDYKIINPNDIDTKNMNHARKVMLYHGRVNGAILFNGLSISGEQNNKNKTITPSSFDGYDLCLFGDIHKQQFIKPHMGYAGSFIQQNMGEDIVNHGIIKWDVSQKIGEFIKFECDYAYLTINIKDKQAEPHFYLEDNNDKKNLRVRFLYQNTPVSFINDYLTNLKLKHNVIEYTFQNNDIVSRNKVETNKLVDITSPETQNIYIGEYLKTNTNANEKEIEMIKLLNIAQNKSLEEENKNKIYQISNFKIKKLEFHNLFSYGTNNVINFDNFNSIVGIIAPNYAGKSSILDIILYTLYDKVSRKGTIKDIINNRKQNFYIKMTININEWTYYIEKQGSRTKKGANVKISFYRQDTNGSVERLEDDSVLKTKKVVASYFGDYEDIINTSFSIQNNNSSFIDSENTQRRKELERILRLDFIEELIKKANTTYVKNKNILNHIETKVDHDKIVKTIEDKNTLEQRLNEFKKTKSFLETTVKNLRSTLLEKTKQINYINENDLQNYESISEKIKDINTTISENISNINQYVNEYNHFVYNDTIKKLILQNNGKSEEVTIDEFKISDELNKNEIENAYKQNIYEYGIKISETYKLLKMIHLDIEKQLEQYQKKIDKYNQQLEEQYTKKITKQDIPSFNNNNDCHLGLDDIKDKIKIIKQQIENKNTVNLEDIHQKEKTNRNKYNKLLKDKSKYESNSLPEPLLKEINDYSKKKEKFEKDEKFFNTHINTLINEDNTINDGADNGNKFNLDNKIYKKLKTSYKKYILSYELKKYKLDDNDNDDVNNNKSKNKKKTKYENLLSNMNMLECEYEELKKIKEEYSREEINKLKIQNELSRLQEIENVYQKNIDIDTKNKEVDTKIEEIKCNINKYQKKIKLYHVLKNNINNILEKNQKQTIINKDIENAILEKANLEKEMNKINELVKLKEQNNNVKYDIEKIEKELQIKENEFALVDKDTNMTQIRLTQIITLINQFKQDNEDKKKMEFKMRLNEMYRNSLKQLPYTVINKISPFIEKKINDLLSVVTDFSIKMDITESKIDIYLDRSIYNGNMIILNNCSGFEKFISSLAIRLALLEITNLPKLNFMAIDEGWSSFDTHNINNVKIIFDFICSKFDFILTISHLNEIKQHCDYQINIKRDSYGFSNVRVE